MKFYFVVTGIGNKTEMAAVKALQPKNLMLSFHYWKNVSLKDFIEFIGYKPNIFLDSVAFSDFTKGIKTDPERYYRYIQDNRKHTTHYMALDKLGDNTASYESYLEMRKRGLNPIPVFHYLGDETILQKYIDDGNEYIALGGTVPIKSKAAVAEWVKMLAWLYPNTKFHLLGSASKKIIDHCDIYSADASTWIMSAIMGNPKHIGGKDVLAKATRAIFNMNKYIKEFD
jgi:hypothetical protein